MQNTPVETPDEILSAIPLSQVQLNQEAFAFSSLALSPDLVAVVGEIGFETMTPIQAKSIPEILKGRDFIGQSKTGSGKTAAFALPILQRLVEDQEKGIRRRDVEALVLCPTRELCDQVAREFRRLGRRIKGLSVLTLCGGQPGRPQAIALAHGAQIVIGTPGRVLDHITRRNLDLFSLSTLVLDEADRMLDMGFEEDMASILNETPGTRQTIFFSATFPRSIKAMSQAYQHDPVHVKIEEAPETKRVIRQLVYLSDADEKIGSLIKILKAHQPQSALVFCNLKATVAELKGVLDRHGFVSGVLHGDLEQPDRDRVMAMFRNHSLRVLVATDVAARGLDVPNLEMVINLDVPYKPEVYLHRIGRTGRAGQSGVAVSIATSGERMRLYEFERDFGVKLEAGDCNWQAVEHPQAPISFGDVEMRTLFISGGRKDKVRPGDILGALTGEAGGLQGSEVGKIEIHDRFSYVAVSSAIAEVAIGRLRKGKIKGRIFQVKFA